MLNKESEEWKLFAEVWKLYKQFYEPPDKSSRSAVETHVDEMTRTLGEFAKQYENTNNAELAKMLCVALVDDFSYRCKRGKWGV